MDRPWISEQIQATVRQRAKGLCEYCHASEQWQYVQFTIDHIIPLAERGSSDLNNLALACFHCNRRKGRYQEAIDPESEQKVALFHPRQDRWLDHFRWSDDCLRIMGITPTGRATVAALALNRERILAIRAADYEIGRHPPLDDRELVLLYWQIGREILARQAQEGWGAKVITPLLARYQQELPQELRAVLPSVAQLEMALNEITEVGGGANDE